jgi:4-hydroxyacetophenone monooxygenase
VAAPGTGSIATARDLSGSVLARMSTAMLLKEIAEMTHALDQGPPLNRDDLRRAVDVANVPTLLMVLFQLTGSERWLLAPYLPTRTRGLDLHDSGGLTEDVQREVRAAAFEALLAWSNGLAPAVPTPDQASLARMMSVCMGEEVDADYPAMMAEDMGFEPEPARRPSSGDPAKMSAIVIGGGVSGLLASVKLAQAGIPHTILEKNEAIGGTWLNNRYPGCGVDTPSFLYTYSFLPNDWPTYFARRDDIYRYFENAACTLDVNQQAKFGVEVLSAEYDCDAREWVITARDRQGKTSVYRSTVVISAVGLLNVPFTPEIEGADRFTGVSVHSAKWPEDLDLTGKRVAVIGAGASSMQIVPAIVDRVAELTIYQRTPQWIAPSTNYYDRVPEGVHWLMNHVPYYRAWYRFRLAWTFNDKTHPSLQIDPEWPHPERSTNAINDGYRRHFLRYLTDELVGRKDLIQKSTPTYPPFGKRMLLDNGWYAALRRPSVDLVTDRITRISSTGIETETGDARQADVIVYATGFSARHMISQFEVRGSSGQTLRDVWGDDNAYAYLGVTVPGFPNFFIMYGPNSNPGHGGSYLQIGESQIRYIVDVICSMVERGIASVDCRDDVCTEYNRRVDQAHAEMIWTHRGMQTVYRNAQGRVVTNLPWRVVEYWRLTHEANLDDFVCEPTGDSSSAKVAISVSTANG